MISSRTSKLNSQSRSEVIFRPLRRAAVMAAIAGARLVLAAVGEESFDVPVVYSSGRTFTTLDGFPSDAIRAVRGIGGQMWIGTDDGLAVFDGEKWKSWTVRDGLPARRIQCIDVDVVSGDVWIGTLGGGLVRLSAGRFDVFNQFNSGLAGGLVFALDVANGSVWAATNGGVSIFNPVMDEWELIDARRADAPFRVPVELAIDEGDLYVAFRDQGVCRWDMESREWVAAAKGVALGFNPIPWNDASRATANRAPPSSPPSSTEMPEADAGSPSVPPTIGVYGPRTRRIALPGDYALLRLAETLPDLLAVQIAVERANADGGIRGTAPFQLAGAAPGYANYGWSLPEDDCIVLADNPALLGVVAHAPDDGTITETVIAHLELPTVSIAQGRLGNDDTDPKNPWVFQCNGHEPARHRLLLDYLVSDRRCTRLAVVTPTGRDLFAPACWWTSYARSLKLPAPLELSWESVSSEQLDSLIARLRESDAQAILTWCDARTASALLRRIRAAGLTQLFVAAPDIMGDSFVGESDAGNVLTMVSSSPRSVGDTAGMFTDFIHKYAEQSVAGRKHAPPNENARRSFDAADHLLAAVNGADPNRESVRKRLATMYRDPFGEDHFERAHGPGEVTFATLHAGRWVYQPMSTKPPNNPPATTNGPHSPESNRP